MAARKVLYLAFVYLGLFPVGISSLGCQRPVVPSSKAQPTVQTGPVVNKPEPQHEPVLRVMDGEGKDDVTSVVFHPDGKSLASGDADKMVKVWHIAGGESTVTTLKGHTGRVSSVAFSPDGKTLASGSWDKTIKLWDLPAAKQADK